MNKVLKLIGLLVLIVFSFFYTDKVVSVIRETDPLMDKINSLKDKYEVKPINGIVTGDTVIPGINGKTINLEKSYKNMHGDGVFDENKIIYDEIKPNIGLIDNRDKFIIRGNGKKKMVSIVFILNDSRYLKRLENVISLKNVNVNYFVSYDYLVNNAIVIKKMSNGEFYNYGDDGVYTPDNILFANNLISRITNNEAIYCLSIDKNSKVLRLCDNNNLYTIIPNIVVSNNPYQMVKNNLVSGSIILMEINNASITEFGIIVDYIRGKGLEVVSLSKLLSENL